MTVPVTAKYVGNDLKGETVDLCEAGLRANFDGYGHPAGGPAGRLDLMIRLEEGAITAKAEVVRNQARGAVWLMSIRFIDDRGDATRTRSAAGSSRRCARSAPAWPTTRRATSALARGRRGNSPPAGAEDGV